MTEENQGSKDDVGDQDMDQNGCEFNTHPIESDKKRTSRCEDSISDKVMLKVVFTTTVLNSNSSKSTFSGNEKSANNCDDKHTGEKLDSAKSHGHNSLKICEMTTAVSTSSDMLPELKCMMQTQSTTQNASERTVSNINHVLNGDDTRSKVNSTTSDVLVAAMQVEEIDGEETNTAENKKTLQNNELQDHCSISASDNNELLSKTFTSDEHQRFLTQSSEEDTKATVAVPITNQETTGENQVYEGANKIPETVKPNNERKRSASSSAGNPQERDESPSDSRPRKRASTISFKVESTTLLREASLEIEPLDVVVSSCSTSPISELEDSADVVIVNPDAEQASYTLTRKRAKSGLNSVIKKCSTSPISELEEDSADVVIVNPDAEQASYTLTRKRAKSGLDSVIKKSAYSARSVKVNAASSELHDGENLSPVSTLNRYRNTFSWTRGKSLTRQSFAGKSKDNFLSFHNISYTVQQKKFFRALGTKVILNNVSGIMCAGINAIMGPSGCGKTSLLDVISGRNVKRGVTGDVVINGELIPENFRCASGYVTQEERITGTLTIKENIMFSAQLRLPRDMTYDEKQEIVEEVINDLGLEGCAHSRVGTEKQRGVSGGERKRTAIAMELIVSPGVLFLDEPTSGLDSTTAISVMNILRNLGDRGCVIILSIHQPRYSILKLFDTITLLSRGEMIYYGSVKPALLFFTNVLGVEHEKYNNPADFFIDVIIRNEKNMNGTDASEEDIIQMKEIEAGTAVNEYAKGYMNSEEYKSIQQKLSPILQKARNNPVGSAPNYANNLFWQVWHLSIRTFKTIVRDLNGAFTTIMAIIVLAIFSGVIFFQLDTTLQGQRDRVGAMFFNMVCNILPGLAGMEALVAERALFIHENANGFYNTGAYFLAKVVMDIIPFRIFTVFLYCPIAYFITGLRSGADRFFFYTLTMMVLSFAAASQVFTFSAVIGVYKVANPLLLMVIAISMVFSGFFITLGNIGVWLRWLQYLSIYRYAFHAFLWNEFEGTVFCNRNTDPLLANVSGVIEVINCQQNISANLNCDLNSTLCGDVLLSRYQFDTFNVWWNILILTAIALSTLIIGFIGLLCATKRK